MIFALIRIAWRTNFIWSTNACCWDAKHGTYLLRCGRRKKFLSGKSRKKKTATVTLEFSFIQLIILFEARIVEFLLVNSILSKGGYCVLHLRSRLLLLVLYKRVVTGSSSADSRPLYRFMELDSALGEIEHSLQHSFECSHQ